MLDRQPSGIEKPAGSTRQHYLQFRHRCLPSIWTVDDCLVSPGRSEVAKADVLLQWHLQALMNMWHNRRQKKYITLFVCGRAPACHRFGWFCCKIHAKAWMFEVQHQLHRILTKTLVIYTYNSESNQHDIRCSLIWLHSDSCGTFHDVLSNEFPVGVDTHAWWCLKEQYHTGDFESMNKLPF